MGDIRRDKCHLFPPLSYETKCEETAGVQETVTKQN